MSDSLIWQASARPIWSWPSSWWVPTFAPLSSVTTMVRGGFPFWAGRPGAVDVAGVARLQEALRAGQAAFTQIAAQYNGLGAGRGPESEAYLRRNIVYELGEPELRGLREFYRRAHGLGLIPRVPELRFHARR